MRIVRLNSFKKDFKKLPLEIQKQADKKLMLSIQDFRHLSLRIKKVQGHKSIWEGSVTRDYRFTFQKIKDIYILRRIDKHEEALKRP